VRESTLWSQRGDPRRFRVGIACDASASRTCALCRVDAIAFARMRVNAKVLLVDAPKIGERERWR
jgi:hypothetical protein